MKSIIKKSKKNIDAIAEARKHKEFLEFSNDADLRLRLAVEVYNQREKQGLSQQDLAREIHSTQKVISKIENGDVNIGIELFNRIAKRLNFTSETLARIFKSPAVLHLIGEFRGSRVNYNNEMKDDTVSEGIIYSSYKNL